MSTLASSVRRVIAILVPSAILVASTATASAEPVRVVALGSTLDVPSGWTFRVDGIDEYFEHRTAPIRVRVAVYPPAWCDAVMEAQRDAGALIVRDVPVLPGGWRLVAADGVIACGPLGDADLFARLQYLADVRADQAREIRGLLEAIVANWSRGLDRDPPSARRVWLPSLERTAIVRSSAGGWRADDLGQRGHRLIRSYPDDHVTILLNLGEPAERCPREEEALLFRAEFEQDLEDLEGLVPVFFGHPWIPLGVSVGTSSAMAAACIWTSEGPLLAALDIKGVRLSQEDAYATAQMLDGIAVAMRRPRSPLTYPKREGTLFDVRLGGSVVMAADAAALGETGHLVWYDMAIRIVNTSRPRRVWGLDLQAGAGLQGALGYRVTVMAGVGGRIGESSFVTLTAGLGGSGIAKDRVPSAWEIPLEASLSTRVASRTVLAWVQPRWVGAAERKDGSTVAPFADELSAGIAVGLKRSRPRKPGALLSLTYQELMGTRTFGAGVGMNLRFE